MGHPGGGWALWAVGREQNVAPGALFSLQRERLGMYRQDWLRVQKGGGLTEWLSLGKGGRTGARSQGEAGHASCHHCSHSLPAPLQKLTMDLTAVLGVLQSQQPRLQQGLQQGAHSAGSSRLYDLYWQAMKFLGVQYVRGEGAPTLGGAGKTLTLHTSWCLHRSVGALGSLGTTDAEVNPALTTYFFPLLTSSQASQVREEGCQGSP